MPILQSLNNFIRPIHLTNEPVKYALLGKISDSYFDIKFTRNMIIMDRSHPKDHQFSVVTSYPLSIPSKIGNYTIFPIFKAVSLYCFYHLAKQVVDRVLFKQPFIQTRSNALKMFLGAIPVIMLLAKGIFRAANQFQS